MRLHDLRFLRDDGFRVSSKLCNRHPATVHKPWDSEGNTSSSDWTFTYLLTTPFFTPSKAKDAEEKDAGQLTSQITGIVDWRREGLRYRKNEVYIDVNESVNLLMGANGNVLRNECSGQVMMKTQLSGMPECKVLNVLDVIDLRATS